MEESDKVERFFKHRRNLLLVAGLFLFLVGSGSSVQELSLLGLKVEFKDAEKPVFFVFLILVYMLVKYFQFLYEFGGSGFFADIRQFVFNALPGIAKQKDIKENFEHDLPISDYGVIGPNTIFSYTLNRSIPNEFQEFLPDGAPKIDTELHLSFKDVWFFYVKGLFRTLVLTTWFAEYAMPILVALLGILLYLFTGSLDVITLHIRD